MTFALPSLVAGPSDAILVRAAKAGDRQALDRLLRRHGDAIRRICQRLAGDPAEADEILQETLCAVTRSIHQFREEAAFTTWVYTLARTHRGRALRRRGTAQRLAAAVEPTTGVPADRLAETTQLRDAIELALATLPELDRQVLLLRDLEGYSAAEVAGRTGLTVPAVKTRLHRARVAMRRVLTPDFSHVRRAA